MKRYKMRNDVNIMLWELGKLAVVLLDDGTARLDSVTIAIIDRAERFVNYWSACANRLIES